MVSRQQHTGTSARTTYHDYVKYNIFFCINMNINRLLCFRPERCEYDYTRQRHSYRTLKLSAVVLVAAPLLVAAVCTISRSSTPTTDLSLPMSSVGVHTRRTYCCSHPVRTGFLIPQRTKTSKRRKVIRNDNDRNIATENRAQRNRSLRINRTLSSTPAAEAVSAPAAVLKPAPKAEETALLLDLVSRFCYVKIPCWDFFWPQKALPSVICVTKLL